MKYREYLPEPALRSYIHCYWTLKGFGAAQRPEPVLPDGSFEIVVHLGDTFRQVREDEQILQPASLLVSELRRPVVIAPTGRIDVIGARFRPGCAWRFFLQPMAELEGRVQALEDVWLVSSLREHLGAGSDDEVRFRILDAELRTRLVHENDPAFDRLIGAMRRVSGRCSVSALARLAGQSPRHLERRFLARVGVSPKTFARVLRFRQVIHDMRDSPADWLDRSLRAGFFDQSHLIRDFRAFAGMTPGDFLGSLLPLNHTFMSDFSNTSAHRSA